MTAKLPSRLIAWEKSNVVIINFTAKIITTDTFLGMFVTNTVLFDNFEFKMYFNFEDSLSEVILKCGEKIEMFNQLYNLPREQYRLINDSNSFRG